VCGWERQSNGWLEGLERVDRVGEEYRNRSERGTKKRLCCGGPGVCVVGVPVGGVGCGGVVGGGGCGGGVCVGGGKNRPGQRTDVVGGGGGEG